jgi:glycosyltransferase involved in cell wall biosynthesis
MVAGERSWQRARALGVPEERIRRGYYGIDYDLFAPIYQRRLDAYPNNWPRRFLYIGRYHHDKGIDLLIAAYRKYHGSVPDAWPLTTCGMGPMGPEIKAASEITDRGFVQPGDLPRVFLEHGVFVIASRVEPWGAVIAESAASGLPVIASEACGASVELIQSHYNGLTVATDRIDALADAMRWMHNHHADLPAMGRHGQHLAQAYSAQIWARRWLDAMR